MPHFQLGSVAGCALAFGLEGSDGFQFRESPKPLAGRADTDVEDFHNFLHA